MAGPKYDMVYLNSQADRDLPDEMRLWNARITDDGEDRYPTYHTSYGSYSAMPSSTRGIGYGTQMEPYQWSMFDTRPTEYQEENWDRWNELIRSGAPAATTYTPKTWGTEQDRFTTAKQRILSAADIAAARQGLNAVTARIMGMMGNENPRRLENLMGSAMGQYTGGINQANQRAYGTALQLAQRQLDEENAAGKYNAEAQNRINIAAYQAALNAMNRGRG